MTHENIARISYGKDSLKMLEVIRSRGLPLDRITTTDVWATDTISANLPPMEEFKARMDERIWQLYRIEVEHLCARNPDGSKKTYEQMFYHVPVRRSQSVQVERERETQNAGRNHRIPSQRILQLVPKTQNCAGMQSKGFLLRPGLHIARNSKSVCRRQGFPAQISPWCRKLKIDKVKTPFLPSAAYQRARTEILWSTLELLLMSLPGLAS